MFIDTIYNIYFIQKKLVATNNGTMTAYAIFCCVKLLKRAYLKYLKMA